jgi:AcrR family transcriptional regulator
VARTVDQRAHTIKRTEILDAAHQLVTSAGYERMSIQDLLDRLGISKGAFYHYFDSKGALLEALVERMLQEAEQHLAPIAADATLPASLAIERFFTVFARYKAGQQPLILAVLPVWYADDNAIVRDKVREASLERLAPLLAAIIERGQAEHAFSVADSAQAARIVLGLTQDLADRLARTLLASPTRSDTRQLVVQMLDATTQAVERIFAAPVGSIRLVPAGALDAWFHESEDPTA